LFDEWFTARDAAGGACSEDDISARALFMADTDPSVVAALLEHMEENLWFAGKTLERTRQLLLNRASEPGRFDVLPLLLARRLNASPLISASSRVPVTPRRAGATRSRRRPPPPPAPALRAAASSRAPPPGVPRN
jgi:hypothetical protein